MAEKLRPSYEFAEKRIEQLRQVVPEAFGDGKIDWDDLREILGQHLGDSHSEKFGLFWPGKREARKLAGRPTKGTLRLEPGEGVNGRKAKNVFIQGENLETLKLLTKSYAAQIKMIYIDPPYNTGNDFIYQDDYSEPLEAYLRRVGDMGEDSTLLSTNTREAGRFHSNWLNFIYPRLMIAKYLLKDDGLIFVSIDDNEAPHLRLVMDEIFGEGNFVEQIVWKNKYGSGALTRGLASVHEYVLCYSGGDVNNIDIPLDAEDIRKYKHEDEKVDTRGGYVTQPLATTSKDERPNLRYPIHHEGHEIWPKKQWVWSEDRFRKAYENDEIVIRETQSGFSVRFKQYLRDEEGRLRRKKPVSIFLGPFNQEGTKEIRHLFGEKVFDFPKPSGLIKRLFSFVINDEPDEAGIYLDFFAGSCPSAQAVLDLNDEDGGERRFIMIQIPEPVRADSVAGKAGFRTIADIGIERIRRVISTKIDEESDEDSHSFGNVRGFEVFTLARSNFREWKEFQGEELAEYQMRLAEINDSPLNDGWTKRDLLVEVMLQKGLPLDSRIAKLDHITPRTVYEVSSSLSTLRLYACFDTELTRSDANRLIPLVGDDVFVCLDSALSDELKMILSDETNLVVL